MKEQIRAQEKAEVSRAEVLLKQLEQEMSELRRREAELEQLSHTDDNITFLQVTSLVCLMKVKCVSFSTIIFSLFSDLLL